MPGEHHTRLPEIIAEVAVDAGVVLQLVGLNELEQIQEKSHEETLACLGGRTQHGRMIRRKLKLQTKLIKISQRWIFFF